jgi:hypothetical protein
MLLSKLCARGGVVRVEREAAVGGDDDENEVDRNASTFDAD